MREITNNEMIFVLSIFKSPEVEYNANSIAKKMGISSMGALKIAKRLEKENIIKSKHLGKAKFYNLNLNNDYVNERWLNAIQIYQTIWALYNPTQVSFVHTKWRSIEPTEIVVWFNKKDNSSIDFLSNIYFTNPKWEKVRLDEIATLKTDFASPEIYTEWRSTTIHIYSEIGNNSVVYPVLKLYDLFWSKEFENMWYKKISSDI